MNLVWDAEFDGLEDYTLMWCLVAKDIDLGTLYQFGPDEVDKALALLDQASTMYGHNIIGFDLPALEKLYGWTPKEGCKVIDTVVLSRLLKSDRLIPVGCNSKSGPHSVEAWGYRIGRGKPVHEDWSQYSPEMLHRCTEDAEIQEQIIYRLQEEWAETTSKGAKWHQAIDTEHRIAYEIRLQETNGVPFAVQAASDLKAQLEASIRDIDQELVPSIPEVPLTKSKQPKWPSKQFKKDGTPTVQALKYYGDDHSQYRTDIIVRTEPINLGSDKQVKDYLLSIGWIPSEWNYKKDPKTGKPLRDMRGNKIRTSPKLTEDSFESLGNEGLGAKIALRLKMSHRLGLVNGLLRDCGPDGRIAAKALPMGTPTSRMTHRQVVNIPGGDVYLGHEMRALFGCDEGYTRVGIDLDQCQIRALCDYMGDDDYQKAVLEGNKEDGTDVHSYAQKLADLATRALGKKLNYTVLFGGGDEKLASDLGMSITEAAYVRRKFFERLPKLDQLQKKLKAEWKARGFIVGLDGRAVWVRAEHMLLVYTMQSFEAIVMKTYILQLIELARMYNLDFKLVTTMHDEVQFLVKDEHVSDFTLFAEQAIEYVNEKFELRCPQAVDIQLGKTWADCH